MINETDEGVPQDWCFDMEQWLKNYAPENISVLMFPRYTEYKLFSFRNNGIFTLLLVILGMTGSISLLKQIHSSPQVFSKRLAVHLSMICIWDIMYLLCCLTTYCTPSIIYGVTPIYGHISYVLFFMQPFASFCVSCTIWQVLAISLERYLAVSSPLEQRTRKAKFGVGWICLAIILGAFIINMLPVPFESDLVPCYELQPEHVRGSFKVTIHTMLKPPNDNISRLYKFAVHFFPDLVFRAPLPIIIIGALTIQTVKACNQRVVGEHQISFRFSSNIPLRLSLLNFKFIVCNTLYMFNAILLELLNYGDIENGADEYVNSFYLTDASNMLLAVHSATNWLIFYHFPKQKANLSVDSITERFQDSQNTSKLLITSQASRRTSIKVNVATIIQKELTNRQKDLGAEIIGTLCEELSEVDSAVRLTCESGEASMETLHSEIGKFVFLAFKWFSMKSKKRNNQKFYKTYEHAENVKRLRFRPHQWKEIRGIVVPIIVKMVVEDRLGQLRRENVEESEIEECVKRIFNHVLSEVRSGVLCASVDANRKITRTQYSRSNSAGILLTPHENILMHHQAASFDSERLLSSSNV